MIWINAERNVDGSKWEEAARETKKKAEDQGIWEHKILMVQLICVLFIFTFYGGNVW